MRCILVGLTLVLLFLRPGLAQGPREPYPPVVPQQTLGAQILRERTVWMNIRGASGDATCLGFRILRKEFPWNVELILTAAHCLSEANLRVSVTTLQGLRASGYWAIYWEDYDLAFDFVKPGLGPMTPLQGDGVWYYPPAGLQVLALISVGGGRPTLTSGQVTGRDNTYVKLQMAAGCGSSGGGVVDIRGNLVGAISGGRGTLGVPDECAGYNISIVGAGLIMNKLNDPNERSRFLARARWVSTQ